MNKYILLVVLFFNLSFAQQNCKNLYFSNRVIKGDELHKNVLDEAILSIVQICDTDDPSVQEFRQSAYNIKRKKFLMPVHDKKGALISSDIDYLTALEIYTTYLLASDNYFKYKIFLPYINTKKKISLPTDDILDFQKIITGLSGLRNVRVNSWYDRYTGTFHNEKNYVELTQELPQKLMNSFFTKSTTAQLELNTPDKQNFDTYKTNLIPIKIYFNIEDIDITPELKEILNTIDLSNVSDVDFHFFKIVNK